MWCKTSFFKIDPTFSLQLNHPDGVCVLPKLPMTITVIHTNGVHKVRIRECGCCDGYDTHRRTQLLRQQWYPATVDQPKSCATFQVLDLYRKLFVTGGLNVHAFVKSLEGITDCLDLDEEVQVSLVLLLQRTMLLTGL